jgi:hypothetical protein
LSASSGARTAGALLVALGGAAREYEQGTARCQRRREQLRAQCSKHSPTPQATSAVSHAPSDHPRVKRVSARKQLTINRAPAPRQASNGVAAARRGPSSCSRLFYLCATGARRAGRQEREKMSPAAATRLFGKQRGACTSTATARQGLLYLRHRSAPCPAAASADKRAARQMHGCFASTSRRGGFYSNDGLVAPGRQP